MAKKKGNERCPLQAECGRKCEHAGHELDCTYYRNNARDELVIDDQEERRENEWREAVFQEETAVLNWDEEDEWDGDEWNGEDDYSSVSLTADRSPDKGSHGEQGAPAEPGRLVWIPTERIYPHPDNPRKDLGDLSELVESIKANGILQNLTVVRYGQDVYDGIWEDEYRVIIGHRRHAAAEKAGLRLLPCIIAEMTEEEQISTMLVENMQRTDLTVYEQAKSFQQLSMDFGKSVSEISAMSGFSETTIRRRQKLAELDDKKVKKAVERGATLFEFAELEKVEDPEAKEKCLDALGTANFKNYLSSALDNQKYKKRREGWLEQLAGFATRVEQQGYVGEECVPMNYYRNYGSWTREEEIAIPSDAETVRYFYIVHDHQIDIYRERRADAEADAAREAEKRRRDAQRADYDKLCAISRRHYELRREFVLNFGAVKQNLQAILGFAMDAMLRQGEKQTYYNDLDHEVLSGLTGVELNKETGKVDGTQFRSFRDGNRERGLLLMAYWMMDSEARSYVSQDWSPSEQLYRNHYRDNQTLDKIYYFLEEIGYQCSDEERQMRRGTHPLFDREER